MPDKVNISIIDDEESIRWVLKQTLSSPNYRVNVFSNGEDALKSIQKNGTDVCLIDLNLPAMDGFSLIENLKEIAPAAVPIVISGQSTMRNTINAMQLGAFEYVSKPFDINEIEVIVSNAVKEHIRRKKTNSFKKTINTTDELIVGRSRSIHEIYKAIGKVASTDISILIRGDSGTGKELIARSIHENSQRAEMPFIAINCAAIPRELLESELFGHVKGAFTGAVDNRKGKFELAAGGTLFLDEIGDMPMELQTKLLRVLQEQEFEPIGSGKIVKTDVRIVSATNKDLLKLIEENLFREDLYYRINVFPIISPPLRERKDDIEVLTQHFLKKGARDLLISPCEITAEAQQVLINYNWPGNIRELENCLKSLMIICSGSIIDIEHLPQNMLSTATDISTSDKNQSWILKEKVSFLVDQYCREEKTTLYSDLVNQTEKIVIQNCLQKMKGNQVKAAVVLGINRNTLRKKIKELDIKAK